MSMIVEHRWNIDDITKRSKSKVFFFLTCKLNTVEILYEISLHDNSIIIIIQ